MKSKEVFLNKITQQFQTMKSLYDSFIHDLKFYNNPPEFSNEKLPNENEEVYIARCEGNFDLLNDFVQKNERLIQLGNDMNIQSKSFQQEIEKYYNELMDDKYSISKRNNEVLEIMFSSYKRKNEENIKNQPQQKEQYEKMIQRDDLEKKEKLIEEDPRIEDRKKKEKEQIMNTINDLKNKHHPRGPFVCRHILCDQKHGPPLCPHVGCGQPHHHGIHGHHGHHGPFHCHHPGCNERHGPICSHPGCGRPLSPPIFRPQN